MGNNVDVRKGWAFIHGRPAALHKNIYIHHEEKDVHVKVPGESLPSDGGTQEEKLPDNLS